MSNENFLSPEKEKRLELAIENKAIQLLKDLEGIRDSSYINSSNYVYMEEVLRNLTNAEYYIVSALAYCKGIDAKQTTNATSQIMNSVMEYLKKNK